MPKYLINEIEAKALHDLLRQGKATPQRLLSDDKSRLTDGNMPFRFKTLEAMGATTAHKANAAIYFMGGTTANKVDTDFVVDDSSAFDKATSGFKGVCVFSTAYSILSMYGYSTATEYMALASTSYATTSTTIVVDTLRPMDGIGTTLTTLNVTNSFGWNILNDGDCHVKWNAYSSKYELIQTRCT